MRTNSYLNNALNNSKLNKICKLTKAWPTLHKVVTSFSSQICSQHSSFTCLLLSFYHVSNQIHKTITITTYIQLYHAKTKDKTIIAYTQWNQYSKLVKQ